MVGKEREVNVCVGVGAHVCVHVGACVRAWMHGVAACVYVRVELR